MKHQHKRSADKEPLPPTVDQKYRQPTAHYPRPNYARPSLQKTAFRLIRKALSRQGYGGSGGGGGGFGGFQNSGGGYGGGGGGFGNGGGDGGGLDLGALLPIAATLGALGLAGAVALPTLLTNLGITLPTINLVGK